MMKINEYGVRLDQNGYAPTIIQRDMEHCYICGRSDLKLDRHEPFNAYNRTKSKNLGMWVLLCQHCHRMCHDYPSSFGESMRRETQSRAMKHYGWTMKDWYQKFGKSVL